MNGCLPPGITRDTLMMRMKPEMWDDVIATNLSGVFYCTQVGELVVAAARKGRWKGERRMRLHP